MLDTMTAGLLVLIAYPLALFYKIPELTGLIALTSLNFFILGGLSQYQTNLIKIKKVVFLVRIEMFSKLIAFMLTVALLYFMPLRPAAVIFGLFTNALIKLICMLYFSEKSWHPTFEFSGDTFKAALKYGSLSIRITDNQSISHPGGFFIAGKIHRASSAGDILTGKRFCFATLETADAYNKSSGPSSLR